MSQINILVADDDQVICKLIREWINCDEYEVFSAYNAEQCISKLGTHIIDLLFLDLNFPNSSNSYEVLDYARENYPDLEIIMISAGGNIQDAVNTLKCGAADFIEKPLTREQIVAKIKIFEKNLSLQALNNDLSLKAMQMIGTSQAMQVIYQNIIRAAKYDSPVLITGDTGVGKELVAKAIHRLSRLSNKNLITVNCGAIPHDLVESELFGYEQGAFTGAHKNRKGYFEYADGSTILLDEISELPYPVQVKLLRILSEGEIQKLGGKIQKVNCRIICATNRNLQLLIKNGTFRDDLFYRINTLHINIPPLRDRREDIPELAVYFMNQFCSNNNTKPKVITSNAMNWLMNHEWKGNVRELKNTIERSVVFAQNDHITVADLHTAELPIVASDSQETGSYHSQVDSFVKTLLINTLVEYRWNISHTAKALEIDRSNLLKKMKAFNIVKPV